MVLRAPLETATLLVVVTAMLMLTMARGTGVAAQAHDEAPPAGHREGWDMDVDAVHAVAAAASARAQRVARERLVAQLARTKNRNKGKGKDDESTVDAVLDLRSRFEALDAATLALSRVPGGDDDAEGRKQVQQVYAARAQAIEDAASLFGESIATLRPYLTVEDWFALALVLMQRMEHAGAQHRVVGQHALIAIRACLAGMGALASKARSSRDLPLLDSMVRSHFDIPLEVPHDRFFEAEAWNLLHAALARLHRFSEAKCAVRQWHRLRPDETEDADAYLKSYSTSQERAGPGFLLDEDEDVGEDGAEECGMVDALARGDYAAAGQLISGDGDGSSNNNNNNTLLLDEHSGQTASRAEVEHCERRCNQELDSMRKQYNELRDAMRSSSGIKSAHAAMYALLERYVTKVTRAVKLASDIDADNTNDADANNDANNDDDDDAPSSSDASSLRADILRLFRGMAIPAKQSVAQVDRRSNLSYEEFYTQYANKSIPVVITDYGKRVTPTKWDYDHIIRLCNDKPVMLGKHNASFDSWGGLDHYENQTTVGQFVRQYIYGKTSPDDPIPTPANKTDNPYLFDQALPMLCPELLKPGSFRMPKYFAGDILQRMPKNTSGYQEAWPSLFVGPFGTRSSLHVDSFGSNFWMAIFQGRKHWRFFSRGDIPWLYQNLHSHTFQVDAFDTNTTQFPLYNKADMLETILEPGDILFVPAGAPHQVTNLDDTLAISGNYIDASNIALAREVLAQGGDHHDLRAFLEEANGTIPLKMDPNQPDLSFEEWKNFTLPPDPAAVFTLA